MRWVILSCATVRPSSGFGLSRPGRQQPWIRGWPRRGRAVRVSGDPARKAGLAFACCGSRSGIRPEGGAVDVSTAKEHGYGWRSQSAFATLLPAAVNTGRLTAGTALAAAGSQEAGTVHRPAAATTKVCSCVFPGCGSSGPEVGDGALMTPGARRYRDLP
jgi:hypothetical protein